MNDPTLAVFKRNLERIAVFIVVINVLMAIFSIVAPSTVIYSNPLTAWYRRLVILGPFFEESRVKSSSHVSVSYLTNGIWSVPREYGAESLAYYRSHPWRYDKLHAGDFEDYLSNQVAQQKQSYETVRTSQRFRELNAYVMKELIQVPADSVTLLYYSNYYLPDLHQYRKDTLFSYTYNPNEVAASKQ